MTTNSRHRHVQQALRELRSKEGTKETVRVPLRAQETVDVIDLPLDVPILNPDSFRIAPQLAAHPERELVSQLPESVEAQKVIADLVRSVHRNAQELKDNLAEEGQTTPGLITPEGKLINGNSRCVLLRDLMQNGKTNATTIRVGVLPGDLSNKELLELEMVLQQQVELKDEYRLVNELMMTQKLYDAGMTDEQIASRRRLPKTKGAPAGDKVRERREILVLMERARRLIELSPPLTLFDSDVDKLQNWRELLLSVKAIEGVKGAAAADEHIRAWLIAYLAGVASVHTLRHAEGDWAHSFLLGDIDKNPTIAELVSQSQDDQATSIQHRQEPSGLELLGADDNEEEKQEGSAKVETVLNITTAARCGQLNHSTSTNEEILELINKSVKRALGTAKRRREAGSKLDRPLNELNRVYSALEDALHATTDVSRDVAFRPLRHAALARATEVESLARRVLNSLDRAGDDE